MKRYYFDTHDGPLESRDEDGEELPDLPSVELKAIKSLTEIARDHMPKGEARHVQIEARDDVGTVLRLTLTLDVVRKPRS